MPPKGSLGLAPASHQPLLEPRPLPPYWRPLQAWILLLAMSTGPSFAPGSLFFFFELEFFFNQA